MNQDSLKKFNQLSPELKRKFSSPETLRAIEDLERKYRLKLALVFVALVVGDLAISDLEAYLIGAMNLSPVAAKEIAVSFAGLLGQSLKSETKSAVAIRPAFTNRTTAGFAARPSPSLTFSTDDEIEVDHYRPLIDNYQKDDYESRAIEIMKTVNYPAGDQVLVKRLENIIVARLKQVRDDIETLEVLKRNAKVGGMEFDEEQAQSLLKMIKARVGGSSSSAASVEKINFFLPPKPLSANRPAISIQEKARQEEESKINLDFNKLPLKPVPADLDFSSDDAVLPPTAKPVLEKTNLNLLEIDEEDGLPVIKLPGDDDLMIKPHQIDIKPAAMRPKPAVSAAAKPIGSAVSPRPTPLPSSRPVSTPPILKKIPDHKPRLDGVKFSPKLVGPLEELSNMTLIDFRRLGDTPRTMTVEIKERIDLLEKDSYGKKLAGVEAWHRSEVNRFYRLLGQTAMTEGKSVETIISERLAEGKPTLSVEEFNAVMELNREIRY